ncbi:endospore germination permease [Paenibacillus polymyxa]|uniref:GerAB/ArcD/ProY family transporter n=1 Tax=Paenibacillus polymyxa TaxID=1406 RepID=UPI0025B62DDE|nr:endospore germination permease [Paenibacillus polymyxa]MDN4079992.1 endospore germination permease [Paenibacillus polymyxa]MDN4105186.1 endospore germination permease [Paenibacillus polymyxa]MDN4115314.1 endospore germination permease [Paenibacillus polymyxa]
MPAQIKISARQIMIISALFTVGSAILIVPSGMALVAKQDAWIAALVGVGAGLLILYMYSKLAALYPEMTLVEMMETLLGKWLGKTVGFLFFTLLFINAPVPVLFYLGNFMTTQMIPETPILAVNILFALIIVFAARLGLEVLARSAELLFPLFTLLYISFVGLVVSNIKLENVQPVLEAGVGPIWPAALSFFSTVFIPHIILLMIFPSSINRSNQTRKAFFIGSLIGGLMLVVVVALTILVFGPDLTARNIYPSYALAKKISIGNFLQRIEAIMATMWFISLFFRITLYMHTTVTAIAQIFCLKSDRQLVLPLGMLLVILSIIVYPNVPYQQTYDTKTWIPYSLSIGLFFPLLLLCIHGIRTIWSKKKTASKG